MRWIALYMLVALPGLPLGVPAFAHLQAADTDCHQIVATSAMSCEFESGVTCESQCSACAAIGVSFDLESSVRSNTATPALQPKWSACGSPPPLRPPRAFAL